MTSVQRPILIINAGSSSIKFSGYGAMEEEEPALLFEGQIESIRSVPHMTGEDAAGATIGDNCRF